MRLTVEQKEIDRKFYCTKDFLRTCIDFEKAHVPHDIDDDALTIPKMLEATLETLEKIYADWRAHIGDPIIDKRALVSRLLKNLAADIESGKVEL